LGSESETCVGSLVHLVGVSISFEKNFYRLPFTPPLSGSPYRSFNFILGPKLSYADFCHAHASTEDTHAKLDFQARVFVYPGCKHACDEHKLGWTPDVCICQRLVQCFFLKYAGELCIIVLIEGKMEPYRRTPQGNTLVPILTHTPLEKRRLNYQ
jgi:hypothetical protein